MRWIPNRVFVASIVLILLMGGAMAQNTMGNITNNQGIITQGQVGNNYLFQFVPPTVHIVGELEPISNKDGTWTRQLIIRLNSQSPANALIVAVARSDFAPTAKVDQMMGFQIMPRGGGVSSIIGGETNGYVWRKLQTPARGEYVVYIQVASLDVKPQIQIGVE